MSTGEEPSASLPAKTSIAAYGASSRSLAAVIALDLRSVALRCASRLGLNTSHERRVGVDSLADIINHLHEVSFTNLKTNDRAGN